MSSSSDPLYTGKNYMDLIDMILRLSNNEEERRAAEKSERRFVEWNCFTIFMEKIEQLDIVIERKLQEAGILASEIIPACDFILCGGRTPGTTEFDGLTFTVAAKPQNIMAIMRVKKYVVKEIAWDADLEPHEAEDYIWANLMPFHRSFGGYLSKVIRVILVARKVMETPPLDRLQEKALETQRLQAIKHTNRPEVHPSTPAELYRYKMRLLNSMGKVAKAFRAEEEAEEEAKCEERSPALSDSKPYDDDEDSVIERGKEREAQRSELARFPAPDYVPPNFLSPYTYFL